MEYDERGMKEFLLVEFKVRFGAQVGYPSAVGDCAVYRLSGACAAMAYPSPVGKVLIEDEDLPGVGYAAYLPGKSGDGRETAKVGQHRRDIDIIRIRIVAGDRTAQGNLANLRYPRRLLRELICRVPEPFVPLAIAHVHTWPVFPGRN